MTAHTPIGRPPSANGHASNLRLTLARLASAKRLQVAFLRGIGLRDAPGRGVAIPYFDDSGAEQFIKTRHKLSRHDPPGNCPLFSTSKGQSVASYGDWRLDFARRQGRLILVEGESDCWSLWSDEYPALGIPGANNAKVLTSEHLAGIQEIFVCREPDTGGAAFIAAVTARLNALNFSGSVRVFSCPGVKDPADLRAQSPEHFREQFDKTLSEAETTELPSIRRETRLLLQRLDTVQPAPVRWLVPGIFPAGKLSLLAGDGGTGKSMLTLSVAADHSSGRPAMGQKYAAEVFGSLFFTCEDDVADTLVPRLLALGADLSKIHWMKTAMREDGKPIHLSLSDCELIERALEEYPAIRLVVIDPVGAFMGRTGRDDHKDSELRTILDPLAELASRKNVAIILIKHLNKSSNSRAFHRVGGSTGYVNAVRVAYLIAPAPSEDAAASERRLMLPIKSNLTRDCRGLAFRLMALPATEAEKIVDLHGQHLSEEDRERLGEQLFRIDWLGAVDADPDTVLTEASQGAKQERPKIKGCADWLRSFLHDHAFPAKEIEQAANAKGFSKDDVNRAKALLKDHGLCNKKRGVGAWWSGFGDPKNWIYRPEPKED